MGRVPCSSSCNILSFCAVLKKIGIWWQFVVKSTGVKLYGSAFVGSDIVICVLQTGRQVWWRGAFVSAVASFAESVDVFCMIFTVRENYFWIRRGLQFSHIYTFAILLLCDMFWLQKAVRHNNNTLRRRDFAHDTIKLQIIEIATLQDFFFFVLKPKME